MMNTENTSKDSRKYMLVIYNGKFEFNLVMDGSFGQPLESTRLVRTSNVRNLALFLK